MEEPQPFIRIARVACALALGAAWTCIPASAQEPGAVGAAEHEAPATERAARQDLAELLEPIRERWKLPALAAGVVDASGLVAFGATGVRRWGEETPVGPHDLWHIGSCTKAMTATLAARYVEQGELAWDTKVGPLFAAQGREVDEGWDAVTLADLLHHLGGAPVDLSAGGLWMELVTSEETAAKQRTRLVDAVLAQPPVAAPGEAYLYSNAGYTLVGAMLEAVGEASWEELIRRDLFAPLGMTSAGFGAPGSAEALDQPRGHWSGLREPQPLQPGQPPDNPAAIGPAGTVHCSAQDWARFLHAHLLGAKAEHPAVVSAASYRWLHTAPDGKPYAAGWLVGERAWAGGPVLSHAGSNLRWYCVAWLAPEREVAFFALTNCGGKRAENGTDRAIGALIGWAKERAEGGAAAPPESEDDGDLR